uniref:Uncharacterized protein n=1 Tax=Oryza punctata TaxID=4537 RepID=A0A0E0MAL7_ORYPU
MGTAAAATATASASTTLSPPNPSGLRRRRGFVSRRRINRDRLPPLRPRGAIGFAASAPTIARVAHLVPLAR